MKKIFAIVLAGIMMLSLAACGGADRRAGRGRSDGRAGHGESDGERGRFGQNHRRGAGGHEQDHRRGHPKAARIGRSGR